MTSSQREPDEREAANTTRDAEQDCVPIEGTEGVERLLHDVGEIEKQLWQCLSEKEHANHPVTTYHLEQIASHLHSLLFILKDQREPLANDTAGQASLDRKSTRLNSSHANISYAVFCLKKKKSQQYIK